MNTPTIVGWPGAEPSIRPRLPLEAVLHSERYDPSGEAEAVTLYDRAMIETGAYDGRQVPVPGREGEVADYGWQEHSARRVSRPARTRLRQALERQGFELR